MAMSGRKSSRQTTVRAKVLRWEYARRIQGIERRVAWIERSERGWWEVKLRRGHRRPYPAESFDHGEDFAVILNEIETLGGL